MELEAAMPAPTPENLPTARAERPTEILSAQWNEADPRRAEEETQGQLAAATARSPRWSRSSIPPALPPGSSTPWTPTMRTPCSVSVTMDSDSRNWAMSACQNCRKVRPEVKISINGRTLKMPIFLERDLHFRPTHSLAVYAKAARAEAKITERAEHLDLAAMKKPNP